jgi:hypothetical protein
MMQELGKFYNCHSTAYLEGLPPIGRPDSRSRERDELSELNLDYQFLRCLDDVNVS